jgi:NAD(P)-dependent dehydrogenase (short-subunit alcohol dehydrogenase family)
LGKKALKLNAKDPIKVQYVLFFVFYVLFQSKHLYHMTLFSQKVIFITGAASGIGKELSIQLAQAGAILYLADLDKNGLDQVANKTKATPLPVDVGDFSAIKTAFDLIYQEQGRLDYVFNNAGMATGGEVQNVPIEAWEKLMRVNLMGVINGATEAFKRMSTQSGGGHIVNTASLAGLIPFPGSAPYATSKHAVVGLSKTLRIEGETLGVKVTAVCPGFIVSNIFENAANYNEVSPTAFKGVIPFKFVPVEKAVQIILQGVANNKKLIIFPFYAKVMYRLEQSWPGLNDVLSRKSLSDFRKLKP